MPKFEFVHLDRPGDEKKHSTKIRRHVMKDIGMSRRKPKRRGETTVVKAAPTTTTERPQPGPGCRAQRERALMPSPLEDCKLSTVVFPVEMNEEGRALSGYVFTEARRRYIPFRSPWLPVGLTDAAAWYITLSYAALFKYKGPGAQPGVNPYDEAIKWYSLSIRSISKRLNDPKERCNEGLIAAITGFVCHDNSTGNFGRLVIHLQGLKSLVDDIGGINKVANPVVRFMISWYDLANASYHDILPHFSVPKDSIIDTDTRNDTVYFRTLLDSWDEGCHYLDGIQSALKATAAVANYINQRCQEPGFWTYDIMAAKLLAPALHMVLSLERRALLGNPSHPDYSWAATREASRRGLLIFLASVKAKFGGVTFELGRHLGDFRLLSQIPHVNWGLVPELNLWTHIIVALAADFNQRNEQVQTIIAIMQSAGLTSSQQALDMVRGIIWVEPIFTDKVETLCHEIDTLIALRTMYQRLNHLRIPDRPS